MHEKGAYSLNEKKILFTQREFEDFTVKKRHGKMEAVDMIKMPVGISDFRDLILNEYYFVDKTKFLCQLMDYHAKVTLFTRPRRFGKTLIMSMVDWFFNIEHKNEAKKLFAGTYVASADEKFMKQSGTKPVLFLSLKDIKCNTYASMICQLAAVMSEVYDSFGVMADSPKLTERQRRYYQLIVHQTGTEEQLVSALRNLLAMLVAYYGSPALLLLDEYDTPIQGAWEEGYYDEAISFMRNFLSGALKDNTNLDYALITGVLRIAKESIFSGLNNFKVSTVVSGGYADSFGFTRGDVKQMAKDTGREAQLAEIAEWYDGYNFQGVEIYNPWSVISYFESGCKAKPYWVNTSSNVILTYLLRRADSRRWREVEDLIGGKTVVADVDENVVYGSVEPDRNVLYTILLLTGYLKGTRLVDAENGLYELAIPNKEIKRLYRREILSKLGAGKGDIALYDMQRAMMAGDAATFEENLQDILRRTVSVHDTAKAESFYHGLMLGFSLYYEQNYRVESNRESGYGRFDLALLPKRENLPGIIMEFKAVKTLKEISSTAQMAKQQIANKAYTTALKSEGVHQIWTYGIAFCGKQVKVV